nr:protein kinase, catalytic domain-containing protein [Tanacetum cinerariifolium]
MDERATRSSREDGTTATERFKESVMNRVEPSKYEDSQGTLSKLLQFGTVEEYQGEFEKLRKFFGSRPATLGNVFLVARTIEDRLDDQAARVAGTMDKTFGNHGGDESESSGQILGKTSLVHMDDFCIDEDKHDSIRLIGVAINSDVADFGSKISDGGSLGERFKESVMNRVEPSKYEDPQGTLSKLLQFGTVEEYQARVAGTMAKTFGNHGGDESESSGLETLTEEDDQSFAEEESYLSGEQYFLSKQIMMDEDELNLLRPDFVL